MTGATDSNCDQDLNVTQDKEAMKEITADGTKSVKMSGVKEVVVNGHIDHTSDLIKDDISSVLPPPTPNDAPQTDGEKLEAETEKAREEETERDGEREKTGGDDLLVLQDSGFNVMVAVPGIDSFELPVSCMELVQEIYQVLIDREDTCHRTCFTLQLEGVTLDNFAELKTIEGMHEGSLIKVVEEPYTSREARIHVRHVRDLLKSVDDQDAYLGVECNSLSYLNAVCGGNLLDKKSAKNESVDCTPPDYIMPGSKERPITALHPITKDNKVPQCVKVLTYSGWNPPPGPRRLHGDLLYLHVVTVEDKRYHVTSCTRGFYINQSSQEEFNPRPAAQKHLSHSLIDLLSQISPGFKKNFQILLKKRSQKHPFERVASPYQVHSWLSPSLDHSIDAIRGEDAFSSRLGYEEHIPGQTRDWNEELQTTRELPRKLLPERLVRERAIFKVHSDFVVAATRGAAAVIDGNIMAINPGEESKMQMFLWNNIFFSLGFDVKDHYKDFGGDAAAYAAPGSDLQGVKAYTSVDAEGLYTLGTVIVDYKGYRVTAQSIIPGILEREQEQSVVYGSIDFGKTVVGSEKYKDLLQKTAQALKIRKHTVVNEKGEEVELLSSVECKGIVGNDSRHYVLDLLRTFPPDANFLPVEGEELNEGSRVLGYPRKHRHKLVCLRQELVDAFVENRYVGFVKHAAFHLQKLRVERLKEQQAVKDEAEKKSNDPNEDGEKVEIETEEAKKMIDELTTDTNANRDEEASREIVQRAAQAVGSLSQTEFNVAFNPDVFQPLVKHAEAKNDALDLEKQLVKDAAEFLLVHQIPTFIRDCLEHTSSPIDGYTLTDALHHHGINIRYLGQVTEMLNNYPQLTYLHTICVVDMLTRVSKRLFKLALQSVETSALSSSVAHFLNCLLGSYPTPHTLVSTDELQSNRSKRRNRKKNRSPSSPSPDVLEWANETGKSLWKKINEEMKDYFNFCLNCDGVDAVVEMYGAQKVSILRGFCKSVGVQLLLRDYSMDSRTRQPFTDEDVLNIFPCVKHIHPKASDAYHVFTTGQAKIQQGVLREGYELINEALNLLNNVYGAMHPEIAACARLLARLNYIMGDYAEALVYQQRAVLMSERVLGIDHPNTITEYAHLALYSFANQQIPTALKLMYRARYLALLCHGENHPEVALFDSNIGLILHAVSQFDLSMRFLLKSLELNTKFFGPHSLKVALSFHLVARTYSCLGDFRTALQNEKEAYAIYKQQLGDDHERTRESSECLRHLTQQAVKFQKTMNQISKGEKVLSLPPLQIQTPTLSNVLETLNHINGIVFVHISNEDIERFKEEMIRRQQTTAKSETGEPRENKEGTNAEGTTPEGTTPEGTTPEGTTPDAIVVNGSSSEPTNDGEESAEGTCPGESSAPHSETVAT